MRAVRVTADGSVELVELPTPRPGPRDAVMRVTASGICGSDLLGWYVRGKAGTVVGHEVAGEIVEVGSGVRDFSPGQRVVPHHHAACLECERCRAGNFVQCREWRASRLDPGGMAELVRIPEDNLSRDTLAIPAGVPDDVASWTEPLATVVKAFDRARFRAGQSVLVIGLGSAGQLAVRLAAARSAGFLAGADRVASRVEIAREAGASGIDVSEEPVGEGARRVSAGGGFDLVFACPANADAIREAAGAVAPGGTLLLFTMSPPGETLGLEAHDLYFREVSIVPSYSCGPGNMREAMELLASGRVAVADLVTHRYPFSRAVEAFARAREPEGCVKVLVVPDAKPAGSA